MAELISTEEAVRIVDNAIVVLERHVTLPEDAPIRKDAELIRQHHGAFASGKSFREIHGDSDLRIPFRRQAGTLDFSKRILHLERLGFLTTFKESLELFARAGVSPSSPMTDYDCLGETDKHHTRLLFEFYVASGITINCGEVARVAGVRDQSQNNPDVALSNCPIEGIACKMVACKSYVTVFNRLMEGAAQIEASCCSNGLVALDVRSCVDPELLVPKTGDSYRTFISEEEAHKAQDGVFHDIATKINEVMVEEDADSYESKTKRRGYLIAAQSFAIIETAHGPTPFNMNKARFVPIILHREMNDAQFQALFREELKCERWIATTPPI